MKASVVIVGSGMAGAHAARTLAESGVDVLVLEAGPRRSRNTYLTHFYENPVKGPQSAYPSMDYAPHPEDLTYDQHYVQAGPDRFIGAYLRLFGGTSWHWTAFADRLRPADFKMKTTYGVADDWPITYEQIVPFYREVEERWGVSGDNDHVWGAPRDGYPYPLPPIPMTYLDKEVDAALQQMELHAAPFSHARNSVLFDNRPACCGNNTCVPICPIGAKYDASVDAAKAEAAGARIEVEALVTFIEAAPDGSIKRVKVRRPDGETFWVEGEIFIIACHAIENPRLLLNSAQETAPNGIANGSGLVGRYLLTQANQDAWGFMRKPVFPYRGPQQTAGIVEMRDGDFRKERAAIGTSFMNSGWSGNSDAIDLAKKFIERGFLGASLADAINQSVSRHLRLNSSAEILPDYNNRIELDETFDSAGVPKPRVTFRIDDYTREGLRFGMEVNRKVFSLMGVDDIDMNEPYGSNAIIAGTTRMGHDPKTSVVDVDLISHQHRNLFILGSSAHVTAPVNAPSLTVAALAIRAARQIETMLREGR